MPEKKEKGPIKKGLGILLAMTLLFCAASALAEETREAYTENGVALQYTEFFEQLKGKFYPYPGGYDGRDGIGSIAFWYLAMPKAEADILLDKNDDEWTDEDKQSFRIKQGLVLELITVKGHTVAELLEMTPPDMGLMEEDFVEVGKSGDMVYYALMMPEENKDYLEGIAPAFQEEYKAVQKELLEVLKNGEYFGPVIPGADLIGKTVSFEARDVDGNLVRSEDIFKEHEITMINVWATWCGNCIRELTELSEMNKRLAEKNVAVIGLCSDADTKLEECKAIIKEYGVEYLNLLPFEGLNETLKVTAFPTSYFVSREGKILGLPFRGAPMDMSAYETVIDGLLVGETVELGETKKQSANDTGMYRVIVSNEEGDLLEGVYVQFCSDSTCTLGMTDANGVAEFPDEAEGTYTIHILKVPEGYEETTEEIQTEAVYSDVYYVLKKAMN